jgi:ATP-dependent 26S proteasome regulatory subunit
MAINRPDTLDPVSVLMRPVRLDRKVEFSLPDLEGRSHSLKIHARSMIVEQDICFELLARLCPVCTGNVDFKFFTVIIPNEISIQKVPKFVRYVGLLMLPVRR